MRQRRAGAPPTPLETKTQPLQERSRATFDAILQAAGELLGEQGLENFSTNSVCARAHITPPALYRYFPNKYALLKELGLRLMQAQDDAALAWMARAGVAGPGVEAIALRTRDVLRQVLNVTRAYPGGLAILRAMRAVPMLRDVRLASSAMVANQLYDAMREGYTAIDAATLRRATWFSTEISNSILEIVLEGDSLDADSILTEGAWMIARYLAGLT